MQLCRLSSFIQPAFQSAFSHVFLAYNTKHYIGAIIRKKQIIGLPGIAFKLPCGHMQCYRSLPLGLKVSLAAKTSSYGWWVGFVFWNMDSSWNWSLIHYLRGDAGHFNQDICQYRMWWQGTSLTCGKYWLDSNNPLSHLGWHELGFAISGMMTWTLCCRVELQPPQESHHISTKPRSF